MEPELVLIYQMLMGSVSEVTAKLKISFENLLNICVPKSIF
jgi:hypothetical protein